MCDACYASKLRCRKKAGNGTLGFRLRFRLRVTLEDDTESRNFIPFRGGFFDADGLGFHIVGLEHPSKLALGQLVFGAGRVDIELIGNGTYLLSR